MRKDEDLNLYGGLGHSKRRMPPNSVDRTRCLARSYDNCLRVGTEMAAISTWRSRPVILVRMLSFTMMIGEN